MIEEKDLYRIYTIPKGSYAGDYKLYFNRKVARLYLPENVNIYKWGEPECFNAEPGDYIEALDGAVVILLRRKKYMSGSVSHWFFRFPMCTIRSYETRSKGVQFGQFYAQMSYLNKNRILSTVRMGTANQKARFATLIIGGIHPFKAYRIAFGNYTPIEISTLHKRINKLMSDEVVREELRTQLMPLAEKLDKQFGDERLVKELDLLLSNSRKGSDAHRENIKFIMALLNKLPEKMYPGAKGKSLTAIDAQFTELAPPLLGSAEK